jgi:TM2 domain-containing membrane protein YozV
VDLEKTNMIRKIIGALVNAFFLPGLGQVICGRVKKGLELIAIVVAIPLGLGALVISAGLFQPGEEFVLPVIILFCLGFLGLFVVWVYALVDVIIAEVKPFSEEG